MEIASGHASPVSSDSGAPSRLRLERTARFGLVAFALLTGAVVSACDPARTFPRSVVGIGVDTQGGVVGYLANCGLGIEGVTLYHKDGPIYGKWRAPESLGALEKWSLLRPGSWSPSQAFQTPSTAEQVNLYGWVRNGPGVPWSTAVLTFTWGDLAGLEPGVVLYKVGSIAKVSEASFSQQACAESGSST